MVTEKLQNLSPPKIVISKKQKEDDETYRYRFDVKSFPRGQSFFSILCIRNRQPCQEEIIQMFLVEAVPWTGLFPTWRWYFLLAVCVILTGIEARESLSEIGRKLLSGSMNISYIRNITLVIQVQQGRLEQATKFMVTVFWDVTTLWSIRQEHR